VLDDGTSLVSQFSYDTAGYFNLTKMIDPLGRTTNFFYSNQIDLEGNKGASHLCFQAEVLDSEA